MAERTRKEIRRSQILTVLVAGVLIGGVLYLEGRRAALIASRKFIDETGTVSPWLIERMERNMNGIELESGVDLRIRIVQGTNGRPLPEYALGVMREFGIGRGEGARGLLIVIDNSTHEARIEVGPHLEGIFPDGFVGYLLREHLYATIRQGNTGMGLYLMLEMIHYRIREGRLGGEYDPRKLQYIADVRRLAAGGGATVALPISPRFRQLLERHPDSAMLAYFAPQPTVEGAYQRHLEYLALGLWPTFLPLYTLNSLEIMKAANGRTQGYNDFQFLTEYGYSYEIDQRDDYAMLYYTGTPFASPHYFRLGPSGWEMDLAAEVRNSQELMGQYYSWRMIKSKDNFAKRFADRYESISGTGFKDEFYRVRGGDDRALCIHGDPTKARHRQVIALCLGDSTGRSAALER